uniref:TSC22 domain family protein 1 n=1 Tax=Castor canadensis TaxID=51338 RepID=A0A8C0ZR09_CASCN
ETKAQANYVTAIKNKIKHVIDLVKSYLIYTVREQVEVLKEQIKELTENNSQLEQENNVLKTLANSDQIALFQAQLKTGSLPATMQPCGITQPHAQPVDQASGLTTQRPMPKNHWMLLSELTRPRTCARENLPPQSLLTVKET